MNGLIDDIRTVSDVVTYPGLNMSDRYIHCCIGGIRQPAKKLSEEDNQRLDAVIDRVRETKNWDESRSFRLSLAVRYYKAEIEGFGLDRGQSRGFTR